MHTDLRPVAGQTYLAYPPPRTLGFPGPIDIEVLRVEPLSLLEMRWSGPQTHASVSWRLRRVDSGCELVVEESGFLGISGEQRRRELESAYRTMLVERLPRLLAGLAEAHSREAWNGDAPLDGNAASGRTPSLLDEPATEASTDRVSGRSRLAGDRRLQVLTVAAAMAITVLIATGLTVLLLTDP